MNKLIFTVLIFATCIFSCASIAKQPHTTKTRDDENSPISLYKPTYILPLNYSQKTTPVYPGLTPEGQAIQHIDFAFQISVKAPIINHLFKKNNVLYLAYTQKSFWQAYNNSPYFRANDYEPEIFLDNNVNWHLIPYLPLTKLNVGAIHQSNGRGGVFERSWNRAYVETIFEKGKWSLALRGWYIFHDASYKLHNPDIQHYMGHGSLLLSYTLKKQTLSLESYNNLESGFKRGTVIVDYSFPLLKHIKGFVQFFSGYGQSLIEYNHRTNAVGIGIAL